ncbi:GNAT family N-acetyltransferase [Pseudochryseolinea flava]|uniref:GNAT family N-acetyltransferase n=1 Tax=Pseudochryseolinea flava TaxID=2059302 RepID=A0A364XU96_9BACT|nr:N-acetyltransferase [Pseudochryseolinea flava]RAV97738.1 GNAT family N-acetyltransferase [Pseudochryseolinea flava]
MHFRTADTLDVPALIDLYKAVALRSGGIARRAEEVTEEHVKSFVEKSIERGLIIVCEHPDNDKEIIAELHAYRNGLKVFDHVLTELTIAVHPDHQGKKIGRTIFTIFLEEVARNMPHIGRVELVTQEDNTRAIGLYQSLGFRIEGRMEMRIKVHGNYQADIPMGWQNPNFEF